MKQIISKSGWLVMAAARRMRMAAMVSAALTMGMSLTMSMASCSSDDDVAQTTPPAAQGVSSIRVSVNAGVDGGTRSHMEYDSSTKERSLQFTSGDKLYVYGCIPQSLTSFLDYRYIAGFLDVVSLDNGNTSATFSGTLYVYKDNPVQDQYTQQRLSHLEPSTYDFGDTDPLTGTRATLYHAGSEESGNMSIDPDTKQVCFSSNAIGSNVGDLMTSLLEVTGSYNTSTKDFTLTHAANSIINCSISATNAAASSFTVSYLVGSDPYYFAPKTTSRTFSRSQGAPFTFAFFGDKDKQYHRVQITDSYYGTFIVDLGQKTLENDKVYNVTRGLNVTSNNSASVYGPDHGQYAFGNNCDIDLSGVSLGYHYQFQGINSTINLNGLSATGQGDTGCFDMVSGSTTTINVSGVNTFTDPRYNTGTGTINDYVQSIASLGVVKLAGNGTLTVTSRRADVCGILASSNYNAGSNNNDNTSQVNVSNQLAAPGYTVIRGPRQANSNGTYSWTYTVTPNN